MNILTYKDKLVSYSLAIVFLLFGIDKFVNTKFITSWLAATERARFLIPLEDLTLAVYILGIIEIIIAVLLFINIKQRYFALIAGIWLIIIMSTARYPSSLPQDLGLLGIAVFLALNKTEKDWIIRYAITIVLILWSVDQIINYDTHIGWLRVSYIANITNNLQALLYIIIIVEFAISALYIYNKSWNFLIGAIFFIIAKSILETPLNNYQSIGFIIISIWLFVKNRIRD